MTGRQFFSILLITASCHACVDIDKPQAVARCSAQHNCSDNPINNDGAVDAPHDKGAAESVGRDGAEVSAPDIADAAADVMADVGGPEPGPKPEPGAEPPPEPPAAAEAGPEPATVAEAGPEPATVAEPAPEPATGPEPAAVAEPGPEPAAVAEPGPEPGAEPVPEPGPEPPPDGGTTFVCPSGAVCDDFEDGNYTANPTWSVPGGFSVVTDGSKVLAYTGTDSPAVALLSNKATALTIKAKVKATTFPSASNSYRVGLFARANSQGTPSAWYGFTITGDGSLRMQVTDSTPPGCSAIDNAAVAGTWYVLTLTVGGTVASTTLQGTLTDAAGGNAKTIGPCTITNGLAAGWAGVGVRGAGTQGEWDEVQLSGIVP